MRVRSAQSGALTILGGCAVMLLGPCARGANPPTPAPTGAASEVPDFQPGLWEYRRIAVTSESVRPRVTRLTKCADPSTEIRTQMAQFQSRGCQFVPLVRRDGRHVSNWTCPTPEGPITYRQMLIVQDRASYAAISETRLGRLRVIQQKMQARRLGECPRSAPRPSEARQTSAAAQDAEIDGGHRYGVVHSPSAVSRGPSASEKRTM